MCIHKMFFKICLKNFMIFYNFDQNQTCQSNFFSFKLRVRDLYLEERLSFRTFCNNFSSIKCSKQIVSQRTRENLAAESKVWSSYAVWREYPITFRCPFSVSFFLYLSLFAVLNQWNDRDIIRDGRGESMKFP